MPDALFLVADSTTGYPIKDAYVHVILYSYFVGSYIKQRDNYATTDIFGKATITIPPDDFSGDFPITYYWDYEVTALKYIPFISDTGTKQHLFNDATFPVPLIPISVVPNEPDWVEGYRNFGIWKYTSGTNTYYFAIQGATRSPDFITVEETRSWVDNWYAVHPKGSPVFPMLIATGVILGAIYVYEMGQSLGLKW